MRQRLILYFLDGNPDADILMPIPWYNQISCPSSYFPVECKRFQKFDISGGYVDVEGDGNCLFYCMLLHLYRMELLSDVWDKRDEPIAWMSKVIFEGVFQLEERDWLAVCGM